jgi:hypothetical protein
MMRWFNRWGGFGNETWPYNGAPPKIRQIIDGRISLDDNEVGLVLYFHDPGTWTLLTSDRLIGEANGSGVNAQLRTITKIEWDFTPDHYKHMLDGDGNIRKRPIEPLTIEAHRKTCTVSIEGPFKSGPHLGLFNAVLHLPRNG